MGSTMYKMVILIRSDLKMKKGKIGAMCGHAAIGAYLKSNKTILSKWNFNGSAKIILKVDSLDQLLEYKSKAEKVNLITYMVRDAGMTQVSPGSITALAIGPDMTHQIDNITGGLSLL